MNMSVTNNIKNSVETFEPERSSHWEVRPQEQNYALLPTKKIETQTVINNMVFSSPLTTALAVMLVRLPVQKKMKTPHIYRLDR